MNPRTLSLIVCVAIQTVHALPAVEAGMVIFNEHWLNALAMAFMQILLGVSAFLYVRGLFKAKPAHRRGMAHLCGWAVAYLAFSTMAEVYVVSFGSPFDPSVTEFIAHTLMFIDGVASLYLWERLKPGTTRPPRTTGAPPPGSNPPVPPALKPQRPSKPIPPRMKGPVKKAGGKRTQR